MVFLRDLRVVWYAFLVMYCQYFHRLYHHSIDRPSKKENSFSFEQFLEKKTSIYFRSEFTIGWWFFLLWSLGYLMWSTIRKKGNFFFEINLTIGGRMQSSATNVCLRHICSKWYLVGFSKRVGTVYSNENRSNSLQTIRPCSFISSQSLTYFCK